MIEVRILNTSLVTQKSALQLRINKDINPSITLVGQHLVIPRDHQRPPRNSNQIYPTHLSFATSECRSMCVTFRQHANPSAPYSKSHLTSLQVILFFVVHTLTELWSMVWLGRHTDKSLLLATFCSARCDSESCLECNHPSYSRADLRTELPAKSFSPPVYNASVSNPFARDSLKLLRRRNPSCFFVDK